MKKIGLVCLLLISATRLMAQDNAKRDSLLGRMYNFRVPNQTLTMPNLIKPFPKDSLRGHWYAFKPVDSVRTGKNRFKNGVSYSPVDHMPIVSLPSNSRMPVYHLKSSDKMPGSNVLNAPQVQVVPQK